MRRAYPKQLRLDTASVLNVELNLECRHEMIPVLAALQHIYKKTSVRDKILRLIKRDVNRKSRGDKGRSGLDYWEILVLAAVRLGCNLNYDELQDLAEQHRALRSIMGIGDWDTKTSFKWKRIQDNLTLLDPSTLDEISRLVVAEGHTLEPNAPERHRVDSFVVETNVHYPTESSLIFDGLGKVLERSAKLAKTHQISGWRQHAKLLKSVKIVHLNIVRLARRKTRTGKARMKKEYQDLLAKAKKILRRTASLMEELKGCEVSSVNLANVALLKHYVELTEQVCGTAWRRVINGEEVPVQDKIFSIYEPHTQLYRRGKAGQENQFGRLLLVFEDSCGFITHQHLMSRTEVDADVAVDQTRIAQERMKDQIERISYDRGFDAPYLDELESIVPTVCLPKKHPKAYAEQMAEADDSFKQTRRSHSGVESAIGALQSGNGLKRCRDRGERGFKRYIGLAILGRNLHTLGKLLIRAQQSDSAAAYTKRKAA